MASVLYYLLCRISPIPAVSKMWSEAGDAADHSFSVVYAEGLGYDEEHSTGSDHEPYSKGPGLRER